MAKTQPVCYPATPLGVGRLKSATLKRIVTSTVSRFTPPAIPKLRSREPSHEQLKESAVMLVDLLRPHQNSVTAEPVRSKQLKKISPLPDIYRGGREPHPRFIAYNPRS
jgi:hypothetical protein